MKAGRALASPTPWMAGDSVEQPRFILVWGFVDSIHHSAKAASIWWEKPEYYSILLECRWAIPQTLWGRWMFNFLGRLERGYCGENLQGQGDLAWCLGKANQVESERHNLRHLEYPSKIFCCLTGEIVVLVVVLDTALFIYIGGSA